MREIARQKSQLRRDDVDVHLVLVLASIEWTDVEHYDAMCSRPSVVPLLNEMADLGVEVIWDIGNTKPHKKLMPTLKQYGDAAIIVVDDDIREAEGWLETMIDDHMQHPDDIIYGQSIGRVGFDACGSIIEERVEGWPLSKPGEVSQLLKPASGSPGTLYPADTFTDKRFFDRELYMSVCPTDDETWQFAFALVAGKTFRCASDCNIAYGLHVANVLPLADINKPHYNEIHNRIAAVLPEYKYAIKERLVNLDVKFAE